MPDISAERLQEMIDCPESSEVSEVKSVAQLLTEARDVITIRNHQNRTLASLTEDAGVLMERAEHKHNRLQQIVIGSLVGLAITAAAFWASSAV